MANQEREPFRIATATDDDCEELLERMAAWLTERGSHRCASLIADSELSFYLDGGYYNPIPNDNWTSGTYTAELVVPRAARAVEGLLRAATEALEWVMTRLGGDTDELTELILTERPPPLPDRDPNWRDKLKHERPVNQAIHARTHGPRAGRHVERRDGLAFDSQSEVRVYDMLRRFQDELPETDTIAIAPLPGVAMRGFNYPQTPDFLVIGQGKAVVVEFDGPTHDTPSSAVNDANRNRRWERCGMPPAAIRISRHDLDRDPALVERVLREDLTRRLGLMQIAT